MSQAWRNETLLRGFTYKLAHIFSEAGWTFSISLAKKFPVIGVSKAGAASAVGILADITMEFLEEVRCSLRVY